MVDLYFYLEILACHLTLLKTIPAVKKLCLTLHFLAYSGSQQHLLKTAFSWLYLWNIHNIGNALAAFMKISSC